MASRHFPFLAATAFAAMLFYFYLKRRSRKINGGEANNDAAANDGIAGGASGAHTSTESHGMGTFAAMVFNFSLKRKSREINGGKANNDAAANDGTARGDSGTHTSTEVPEMPTSSGYDYEVFLSFRGPDTGSTFADFLYTSLIAVGIRTFRDDGSLRIGEELAPELLQAIKQSKISIPIFSKDYASSVWCLKELVQMVECQKTRGQKIVPIFYDVAPSEVRYQTGVYGEAFRRHENKKLYDQETLQEWKAALRAVGALKGWDLHSSHNRRVGEFTKTVTQAVFNELKNQVKLDFLVSVDHHVDEITELIGAQTSETRIIAGGASGAHTSTESQGMGTFAAMVFNFFLKRRSRAITGGEANNDAAANDGIAGGASGAHTSTESHGMGTFAAMVFNFFLKRKSREINGGKANNDAAANDGIARGDSGTHTSTEVPEMPTSSGYDYEVFLSFTGVNAASTFADFLYTSLIDVGIRTFRDDGSLRIGKEPAPELLQAIKQSKISIPIFSKDYASSVRCLKDLVQMVECQKTRGQKIMPIFYDVAPSEVRYQTGWYGEDFRRHENWKRYDQETLQEWKVALRAVGALKGWDLHSSHNRREGEFTKTVTQEVFNELKNQVKLDFLVSVDHHVDEITELIGAQTSETRIIGIYGMGGIGKTTIAKIIYNQLSNNFKDRCFLSNIRETSKLKGTECLQNQLISDILKMKWTDISNIDEGIKIIKDRLSNKRVLLLLDDVGEKNHMDALVGKRDWFGKGSKLIITSRSKYVLDVPEVDCKYELIGMDDDQSLQLFSKHAFRRDYPLLERIDQSKKAVAIAGGLPLVLEVIGSLLQRTVKEKWDVTLKQLENIPHEDVQSKLKISYDALNVREQHIFLDIACLFIGYDKDILVHFWNEFKYPEEAMEFLQNMSLIKINEDNEVWMHDQLKDLGRHIVCQKSNMKIGKQSRVWNTEEALDLLMSNEEQEVEALCLKLDHKRQYCFTDEDFVRLSNLRFLAVDSSMGNFCAQGKLPWHKLPSNVLPTNFFQETSGLLPQLQWLSWHNFPLIFDIKKLSMVNMVIVDLSRSEITHDWNGWSHMKVIQNLKVLNLTDCCCLKGTPDVSFHTKLERLILRGCSKLDEIDRLICHLKHLVCLDVRNCQNLRRLPNELGGLEALQELRIDSTLIEEIPKCQRTMNLRILTASDCRIITLPHSIGELATLEHLSLGDCGSLKRFPDSIGGCKLLIELDISGTSIEELPDSIINLGNLKVVKMTRSRISKIPYVLWTMKELEEIEAADNPLLHVEICNDIDRSSSLMILELICAKIHAVPRLPEGLVSLRLSRLCVKTFPDLSNLINLKELYLSFATLVYDVKYNELVEDPLLRGIGKLHKLESLELYSDNVTTLPRDFSFPDRLKALELACSNLHRLPDLPPSLSSLCLYHCKSLCSMDLSNLIKLSSLVITSSAISEIRGLNCLRNLQNLRISDLGQVEILPDLSDLNKLRSLQVRICGNLVEIQGELPQSLEDLEIYFCGSLQKLPDLSSLKGLQYVAINDCMKLNVEAILGFAQRSRQIFGRSWR